MSGKISGNALAWADVVVEGTFFLMQNYLTDVWKMSFFNAAAFLNIWGGLHRILPIFLVFLTRKRRSDFLGFIMLALSGIFSTTGLVVITYTALPGYHCHKKGESECVGRKEKALFITGMALILLGRASRFAFSLPLSIKDEIRLLIKCEPLDWSSCGPVAVMRPIYAYLRWILAVFFFVTPAVAFFAFPYVNEWYILFGVSAVCTALATFSHLMKFRSYNEALSDPSLDTTIPSDHREVNIATNTIIRLVMSCSAFVVSGMVSSIGNTYFVQQATQMNYNIGQWKPPLQVLQLIFLASKLYFALGCKYSMIEDASSDDERDQTGGGFAILFSVVCCTVAAAVERRRVHVVRRHGLIEQAGDVRTPMSAFWLLFQVCFLGIVEGFVGFGLSEFDVEEATESMKECLGEAVTGLGYMCGVLSVYVVGKISERGGGKGWFQHTLNRSRLDRYYWVLAAFTAVFLFVYLVLKATMICVKEADEPE